MTHALTGRPALRRRLASLIAACAPWLAAGAALAQAQPGTDFPARPIRFVLISSAGSGGDTIARLLADKMGPLLKGGFVIENKPGAGGAIAVDATAKAAPDGHTITMGGATTHVLMPAVNPKLPYHPIRDFAAIGQVGTASVVLMAANDFPANTLAELVALARKQPGLQYASWGNGSTGHFCGALMAQRTRAELSHVPYKSVAQIQTDLYGGHMKLGWVDMASAVPMVKSGRAKAISLCTSPSPSLPGVRSFEEDGIDDAGKRIGAFRWALYAPAATPKPVVAKLAGALKAALEMPDVRARLLELGVQPGFLPGEEVQEASAREIESWRRVAQEASIRVD